MGPEVNTDYRSKMRDIYYFEVGKLLYFLLRNGLLCLNPFQNPESNEEVFGKFDKTKSTRSERTGERFSIVYNF